jgi:hypothetical protein
MGQWTAGCELCAVRAGLESESGGRGALKINDAMRSVISSAMRSICCFSGARRALAAYSLPFAALPFTALPFVLLVVSCLHPCGSWLEVKSREMRGRRRRWPVNNNTQHISWI